MGTMEIGDVSSNTFVQQISGIQSSKQIQPTNPNNDANITAVLERSQNIGETSTRRIEEGATSEAGTGVKEEEQGKARTQLDLFI